ncbi:mechanosensitive ion channel family protein [Achromobacter aloeverae]|uniref:Mechanosensitive ion channel protein MscS n=1 Tax=Achromobacter aloeverae TaxID=1750518 RepID=A0A4V1MSJ0_9BURK|nr:mechanosensitive ion channel family protein [Achromobacter aloeverae]RXN92210.1 mechanosensitive ion channel protein MscS [Achromobacter aloeverae]
MSLTVLDAFFTDTKFLQISLANWLLAIVVAIVVFLVARFVISFVRRRLRAMASLPNAHVSAIVADVVSKTSNTLLALAALLIGMGVLDLPQRWATRLGSLWFVVAILQIALWAHQAILLAMHSYFRRHASVQGNQLTALAALSVWAAKVLLWGIVLLAMLSNMGVNITAFVASLGVGGIAVALAVQNILGDLFASLSIAVDKPFEVGDFIVVGSLAGTVEHVGLKTTRIRSLGGEQIVMSNASMLSATIQNYKRLQERRIVFQFSLTHDCSPAQARQVPRIVEQIVKQQERTRFDRAHFKGFGESFLDFEVVYIVLDPGYNVYMDIQQAINIGMMESFADLGVRFAFPARTLYVASLPEPGPETRPSAVGSAGRRSQAANGDAHSPGAA